jgi:hypothetical protein
MRFDVRMDTDEERNEQEEAEQRAADELGLRAAQRLAAIDEDVRIALDHAWWTGLRDGLETDLDRPVSLPRSPFSRAVMDQMYPNRSAF